MLTDVSCAVATHLPLPLYLKLLSWFTLLDIIILLHAKRTKLLKLSTSAVIKQQTDM